MRLRLGLTLYMAAITGNCYDRAIEGVVTDFIGIRCFGSVYFMNFADIVMWFGAALTIYGLFEAGEKLWHSDSKRSRYLIDSTYQFSWATRLTLISTSTALIVILFSYTYLRSVTHLSSSAGTVYLLVAFSIALLFSAVTFFAGVLFSHRSVGPIHALENYLDACLKEGSPPNSFQLRRGDDHRERLMRISEKIAKVVERGF